MLSRAEMFRADDHDYRAAAVTTRRAANARRVGANESLAPPEQAKVVRAGNNATPVTDGVFPEAKEFLLGYWIVDVESPERAYEIAARLSAGPGPGGVPTKMPIEVRQILSRRTNELT